MPSAVLGDGSDTDEECVSPVSCPQLLWRCHANGPLVIHLLEVEALIDNGSSLVLIGEEPVARLGLRTRELPKHATPLGLFRHSSPRRTMPMKNSIIIPFSPLTNRCLRSAGLPICHQGDTGRLRESSPLPRSSLPCWRPRYAVNKAPPLRLSLWWQRPCREVYASL